MTKSEYARRLNRLKARLPEPEDNPVVVPLKPSGATITVYRRLVDCWIRLWPSDTKSFMRQANATWEYLNKLEKEKK